MEIARFNLPILVCSEDHMLPPLKTLDIRLDFTEEQRVRTPGQPNNSYLHL